MGNFMNRGKNLGTGFKNRGPVIEGGSFTNRGAEDQPGREFKNRGQDWFGGAFKNRGQTLLESSGLSPSAHILIDWYSVADNNYAVATDEINGTPTRNVIAVPTGYLMNEGGGTTPPQTGFYATETAPDGSNTAVRFAATATQTFYIFRSGTYALANGSYALRFKCKATNGTGPHTIDYGLASSYASTEVTDAEWTTLTRDITYAGSSDIGIRLDLGQDILVAELQLYPGTVAEAPWPDWANEVIGGGHCVYTYPNTFAVDAEGNPLLVKDGGRNLVVVEPNAVPKNYTAITIMQVMGFTDHDVEANTTGISTGDDNEQGLTNNTVALGMLADATFIGGMYWAPTTANSQQRFHLENAGVHIFGYSADASAGDFYLDTVPVNGVQFKTTAACPDFSIQKWYIGGASTTNRIYQLGQSASGPVAMTIIWDKKLTQSEWETAVAWVKSRMAGQGRTIGTANITDFHIIDGDSNDQMATGDWTQLASDPAYFAPADPVWMVNYSEGGTNTETLTTDAVGRWTQSKLAVLNAANAGMPVCYHYTMGTNDIYDVDSTYTNAAGWATVVQGLIDEMLAVHPDITVMYHTPKPRGDAAATTYNWESNRLAMRTAMLTYAAGNSRVYICDWGNPASTVGNVANIATYYQADGIHLTAAGDAECAAIFKTAVEAWRTDVLV